MKGKDLIGRKARVEWSQGGTMDCQADVVITAVEGRFADVRFELGSVARFQITDLEVTDDEVEYFRAVTYQIDRWLTIKIDECIDRTGTVRYSGINPDNIRGPWIEREYKTADYKAGLKMAAKYISRKGWKVTEIQVRSDWYKKDWK